MNDRSFFGLSRYRAHVVAVLAGAGVALPCLDACSSSGARTGTGFLVAPMTSASESRPVVTDAGSDGGRLYRPFPNDADPRHRSCDRKVDCISEDEEVPDWPYPPPYSKCAVTGNNGGTFSERSTREARHDQPRACCYVTFDDCEGKRVMRAVPGRALPAGPAIEGEGWEAMAGGELLSVLAFRGVARDLAALGAPRALVAAAYDAADDEAAHAVAVQKLARRRGVCVALDDRHATIPDEVASLDEVVRAAFVDGCLGEGVSAASLELAAADHAGDDACILHSIARDELRHADLAWRTLAWAITTHPDVARPALRAAIEEATSGPLAVDGSLLDEDRARALAAALWSELIPLGEALLAA